MTRPSKNLSWAELACKDAARTPYPAAWRTSRAKPLAALFEAIRAACGDQPITVLSAYRTPSHNRAVGGARYSQHVQGRALDLKPPTGWTVERFYRRIRETCGDRVGGLGRYATFAHVDIRPTDRLVAWTGRGAKDTPA